MGYYVELFTVWFGLMTAWPLAGYMMNRGIVQKAVKAPIPLPHRLVKTKVFL